MTILGSRIMESDGLSIQVSMCIALVVAKAAVRVHLGAEVVGTTIGLAVRGMRCMPAIIYCSVQQRRASKSTAVIFIGLPSFMFAKC